ncbi:MAG: hypothetical protein NDJ24_01920 [Alphaproteobacteria bacterium]|nr:hypothetical protein [Alphaproteobacteria bacterium]
MAHREPYSPKPSTSVDTTPFTTAEEAWFWFIQAQAARNDGARFSAGQGLVSRPCEPIDILKIIDRLYRQRRLLIDHLLVLRHYGRRLMAPDARRLKEVKAHSLWVEALERMTPIFERKGIVQTFSSWHPFAADFSQHNVIPFSLTGALQ